VPITELELDSAQTDEFLVQDSAPLGFDLSRDQGSNEPQEPRRFTTTRRTEPTPAGRAPMATSQLGAGGSQWTPNELPPPTYTLMSPSPRWEPKALTALDYARARDAAARAAERAAEEARAEGSKVSEDAAVAGLGGSPQGGRAKLPPRVVFTDNALDLDRAIVSRRRAVGGK
jgi:hypothetical protein